MDYKERLEKAKELYPTANTDQRYVLECLFPELKESEDERIRKSIISGLKYLETELGWDAVGDVDILDAYAWLEKQGEQKSQRMVSAEAKEALWPDKYEGLTDFERTLADVCIDWLKSIKQRIKGE